MKSFLKPCAHCGLQGAVLIRDTNPDFYRVRCFHCLMGTPARKLEDVCTLWNKRQEIRGIELKEEYYQDGIKLPMKDDEPLKSITMKEHLARHIEACALLGEAHGMLNSFLIQIKFQDQSHKHHVEQCIKRWAEKMEKFVEIEIKA